MESHIDETSTESVCFIRAVGSDLGRGLAEPNKEHLLRSTTASLPADLPDKLAKKLRAK